MSEIEAEYRRRLAARMKELALASATSQRMLGGVLLAGVALVFLGYALVHGAGAWPVLLPLAGIAVFLPLWQRARGATLRAMRLVELYERALGRVDGSAVQSGHTGEEFAEVGHLYERDLNVLGPDSLFGMLATTRTAVGQRALARILLEGAGAEEARARQRAVQELAGKLELRERVSLLGSSSYEVLPADRFDVWLAGPAGVFQVWMRWVLAGLTVAWIGVLVGAAVLHGDMGLAMRNAAALLAVQGAFCLWLRARVGAELEAAQKLSGQTAILRDGLRVLRGETFAAGLLTELQVKADGEEQALKRLAGTLVLVEQRAKEWYYAPALLLGVGTHAAISLSLWRAEFGEAMLRWVAAWAEFEALLAVATYAAEHADSVYPEILDGVVEFVGEGLAHPLLRADEAVRNDVRLDEETRFLLISGSNMAGKSTLLRAVGTNVVLGLCGAPVCARRLRLSALRVGASLALVDSLAEGKSKFLAEVERLRDLVGLARSGSSLFLIDEIFSGTNSTDRRAAAEAVLRGLMEAGAIGALSTHDLALAELAEVVELHGKNVHMASPDEDDPLRFDYLLKDGVNRMTNGLAIVRMLGLVRHCPTH